MRNRRSRILLFAPLAIVAFALFVYLVMSLWNWLMPALFTLHAITYWQALGIMVLARVLFGGFRGGCGHGPMWRRRMIERYDAMSPEEREKFREGMWRRHSRDDVRREA